jgi:hypothetical protein
MLGSVRSGMRSTGSRMSEIAPSRMMTEQIMNIVIGR